MNVILVSLLFVPSLLFASKAPLPRAEATMETEKPTKEEMEAAQGLAGLGAPTRFIIKSGNNQYSIPMTIAANPQVSAVLANEVRNGRAIFTLPAGFNDATMKEFLRLLGSQELKTTNMPMLGNLILLAENLGAFRVKNGLVQQWVANMPPDYYGIEKELKAQVELVRAAGPSLSAIIFLVRGFDFDKLLGIQTKIDIPTLIKFRKIPESFLKMFPDIEKNPNVSVRMKNGSIRSPLTFVASNPRQRMNAIRTVTWALVKAGADVNMPDGSGVTPLVMAQKMGNVDLQELLMRFGAKAPQPTSAASSSAAAPIAPPVAPRHHHQYHSMNLTGS